MRVAACLITFLLAACSGGDTLGGGGVTVPEPLATSDLSILGLHGTTATVNVSHLPILYYHDDFGSNVVTPDLLSIDGEIAAGERRQSYEYCAAWVPLIGCILLDTSTSSTHDLVELTLTANDGGVDVEVSISESRRQEPAGGATDSFTAYFNDGDPLNALIFNMGGPDGNGFEHATIILWSQAWGEDAAGKAYAWASILGEVPSRIYHPDDGWHYTWETLNSGTASYTGPMEGLYLMNSEFSAHASGDAILTVDFDSATIEGRLSNILAGNKTFRDIVLETGGFPDSPMDRLVLSGIAVSDTTDTSTAAPDLSGNYSAMLYGNGAEVGGTFAVEAGPEVLIGGFLGKPK